MIDCLFLFPLIKPRSASVPYCVKSAGPHADVSQINADSFYLLSCLKVFPLCALMIVQLMSDGYTTIHPLVGFDEPEAIMLPVPAETNKWITQRVVCRGYQQCVHLDNE